MYFLRINLCAISEYSFLYNYFSVQVSRTDSAGFKMKFPKYHRQLCYVRRVHFVHSFFKKM